jgi:hypothetical protein
MSESNSAGDIATFNIHYGFCEALVRGYRSGFLNEADYHRIVQCETLEGRLPLCFCRGKVWCAGC